MLDSLRPARPVVLPAPPADWRSPGSVRMRLERRALTSLVLGIVSLVVNPLLIPGVVAIVLGVQGRRTVVPHRTRASVGLATGITSTVLGLVAAAVAIPLLLAFQHAVVERQVESAVVAAAADHGVAISAVSCPEPSTTPSSSFVCSAQETSLGAVTLQIAVGPGGAMRIMSVG